jgi:hypothetical protein
MATGQMAVHLTEEMLNSVDECADRARIYVVIEASSIQFILAYVNPGW